MSDFQQGPGWWYASDGKWYPPQLPPTYQPVEVVRTKQTTAERLYVDQAIGGAIGVLLAIAFAVWLVSFMD